MVDDNSRMVSNDLFVVTGASHGIGLECVRQLSKLPHGRIYLTCRDTALGEKARTDLGLPATVLVRALDVTSQSSIDALVADLLKEHGEKSLRALINNAGVLLESDAPDQLKPVMDVNYWGTRRMMVAFRNLMRPGDGRIVNVMSRAATYNMLRDGDVARVLRDPKNADELDRLANEVVERPDVLRSKWYDEDMNLAAGFYVSSKALGLTLTKLMAPHSLEHSKVAVISVCPGTVKGMTDKGEHTMLKVGRLAKHLEKYPPKSLEDGAATLVWAATLDKPELYSGKFYGEQREVSLESGDHL